MKIFYILFFASLLFISGCTSESTIIKKYKTVYEPVVQDSITSYYVSGIPFGSYENDKYSLIFSVQATDILDNEYLSFWVLLKNKGEEEYLLEPTKIFKMYIMNGKVQKNEIFPESPLVILKDVEYSKQTDLVMATIGSAFKTISSKTVSAVEREGDRFERRVNNINNWYDLYSESVNNGILRKNSIFQNKSVNGVVYFLPYGEIPQSSEMAGTKYEIKVIVDLPNEKKELRFKPVAGE